MFRFHSPMSKYKQYQSPMVITLQRPIWRFIPCHQPRNYMLSSFETALRTLCSILPHQVPSSPAAVKLPILESSTPSMVDHCATHKTRPTATSQFSFRSGFQDRNCHSDMELIQDPMTIISRQNSVSLGARTGQSHGWGLIKIFTDISRNEPIPQMPEGDNQAVEFF